MWTTFHQLTPPLTNNTALYIIEPSLGPDLSLSTGRQLFADESIGSEASLFHCDVKCEYLETHLSLALVGIFARG